MTSFPKSYLIANGRVYDLKAQDSPNIGRNTLAEAVLLSDDLRKTGASLTPRERADALVQHAARISGGAVARIRS